MKDKQILEDFRQRRKIFNEYIQNKKLEDIFICPSCGYPTLDSRGDYDICNICGWEDDYQDDAEADEIWGGPNGGLSLTASRLIFGKSLNEKLASGRKVILDPAKVMSILGVSDQALAEFVNQHISDGTIDSDTVLEQYRSHTGNILDDLVE